MNPRNFLSALRIHFRDIGEELYSEGVFLAEYVFVSYHPAESRFLVQMKASTVSYFIDMGEFTIVAEDPEHDNRQVFARMLPSAAESIKEAKGSMGGQKEDGNFGFFALKVGLPLGTEFWRAIFEKHLGSFGLILNSIGYTKDIAGSVQNELRVGFLLGDMVRWDKMPSRLNRIPYRGSEYAFKISKQFAEEHGLCREKECCRFLPYSKHAPRSYADATYDPSRGPMDLGPASFTGENRLCKCATRPTGAKAAARPSAANAHAQAAKRIRAAAKKAPPAGF